MPAGSLFLLIAAVYGASGVALGAFGAHGLKDQLGPTGLSTWQTAVTYHLVHALALLATGLWLRFAGGLGTGLPLQMAGWAFVVGVLLFSGSLYALSLGGPRVLGPVTPLGGIAFIVGWIALIWAALRTAGP
ncbi:MAG TPA: DUF423 domain-containing protein [Pseudomonadales bacterium]